ncbi:4-hydroxythreonine-4-phosphate dehydrogenase PdxA [Pantoea sp. 18069]|uniref:4-hydroxythreonine-4-phosphate dehydrogenase PdxA n=1 Tax=Pantoea sp. 18069 TaxID=2681415 RepID=UPI00190F2976|nr:4-hydroxythreonine-4-phosphate dehydrogenase PdxA [Pantoea sp. 18069]
MARLLALPANRTAANLLLIGDACVWKDGQAIAGVDVPTHTITELADYVARPGDVTLLDLDTLGGKLPVRGQSTEEAGRASFIAMEKAIDAVSAGVAQAIVFAPLNKHSLRIGGLDAEDELRHMQQRFGVESFVCEFNIAECLWTSRVTSHVPVREIADHIDQQGVEDAIAIIWGALRQAGIESPRVAVCGLNPHAGDGGSIGREEIDIIAPAVQAAQRSGKKVLGPFPSDTVFIAAQRGDFDAVVCMYHDQGQIAMKLMGFDKGVTLHGGLPVPVATSASGSAFDIAGKGLAKIHGLQRAFDLCVRMGAAVPRNAATSRIAAVTA